MAVPANVTEPPLLGRVVADWLVSAILLLAGATLIATVFDCVPVAGSTKYTS